MPQLQTIDLADMSEENCKLLVKAISQDGFALIKNHLFEKEELDKLFEINSEFFSLPLEEKQQYPISLENDGYVAPEVEDLQFFHLPNETKNPLGDIKEAFNISNFDLSSFQPRNMVPMVFHENMGFVSACLRKYYVMIHILCRMLAIGMDLKDAGGRLTPELFSLAHSLTVKTRSTLRFLKYSNFSGDPDDNLCGAHTDYGSITLGFQRPEHGLQYLKNNQWLDVLTPGGEMIMNIGDVLSLWTDGQLKSTLHRVRCVGEREAILFYAHPADNVFIPNTKSTALSHFETQRNRGYRVREDSPTCHLLDS